MNWPSVSGLLHTVCGQCIEQGRGQREGHPCVFHRKMCGQKMLIHAKVSSNITIAVRLDLVVRPVTPFQT